MAVSVRLDDELGRRLAELAKRTGRRKSDLIRESLTEYLDRLDQAPDPWEVGKDLFGRYGSSQTDLARRSEEILQQLFAEKGRAGRRRA